MNKKGFTLVELLAVIVILAIIMLIAIPQIMNIVEKSKRSSALDSAYGYIDAVEKQLAINEIENDNPILDGDYDVPLDAKYKVKVKGGAPTSGSLTIEKSKVKTAEICVNDYTVRYNGTTAEVIKKCNEDRVAANQIDYKNGQTVAQALDDLREGK